MEKVFKGYVSIDEEYGYVGVQCRDVASIVNKMISDYVGSRVTIRISIDEEGND